VWPTRKQGRPLYRTAPTLAGAVEEAQRAWQRMLGRGDGWLRTCPAYDSRLTQKVFDEMKRQCPDVYLWNDLVPAMRRDESIFIALRGKPGEGWMRPVVGRCWCTAYVCSTRSFAVPE
jgi:hypothetical protein